MALYYIMLSGDLFGGSSICSSTNPLCDSTFLLSLWYVGSVFGLLLARACFADACLSCLLTACLSAPAIIAVCRGGTSVVNDYEASNVACHDIL